MGAIGRDAYIAQLGGAKVGNFESALSGGGSSGQ
jgi:hypothetical protein